MTLYLIGVSDKDLKTVERVQRLLDRIQPKVIVTMKLLYEASKKIKKEVEEYVNKLKELLPADVQEYIGILFENRKAFFEFLDRYTKEKGITVVECPVDEEKINKIAAHMKNAVLATMDVLSLYYGLSTLLGLFEYNYKEILDRGVKFYYAMIDYAMHNREVELNFMKIYEFENKLFKEFRQLWNEIIAEIAVILETEYRKH